MVLGLGPGTRDTAPLNSDPPSLQIGEAAVVDATRVDASPCPVWQAPLAGMPPEPQIPDSTLAVRRDAPASVVAEAKVNPTLAQYCIAVDGHLLSAASPDGR